jgi:pyruvate carboxylase
MKFNSNNSKFNYSFFFFKITIEKGKSLRVKVLAIGELKGGEREVFFELNGQLR